MKVMNPVLKGFNPDPSFLRVGKDYYIATSTFEWFPGVCLYHSQDMVNWERVGYALDDKRLCLTGIDQSCGIWAPNLTWSDGKFYLLYTIVYTDRRRFKDTHNYLVTAEKITGPWSAPVRLNKTGFDPSMFHDIDGRKWLVNMTIDYRNDKKRFGGIVIQEYDVEKQILVGEPVNIFRGTEAGTTEGPNIIYYNGFYYLTVAEGGTEFGHQVSMARSRKLLGPYEASPYNPVLTSSWNGESSYLKRAGHGQLLETENGSWYMAHLCSRSLDSCSILGRETAIQDMEHTKDGWFRLRSGGVLPQEFFTVPETIRQIEKPMQHSYMTLREPKNQLGIRECGDKIEITGGNSLSSKYNVHLLAKRLDSLICRYETKLHFEALNPNHMAGIVCYYNYDNYYYLYSTAGDDRLTELGIISCIHGKTLTLRLPLGLKLGDIIFRLEIKGKELCFSYSADGREYKSIGAALDMRVLSDERIEGNGFTGTMVGICCQDLSGDGCAAEFTELRELPSV